MPTMTGDTRVHRIAGTMSLILVLLAVTALQLMASATAEPEPGWAAMRDELAGFETAQFQVTAHGLPERGFGGMDRQGNIKFDVFLDFGTGRFVLDEHNGRRRIITPTEALIGGPVTEHLPSGIASTASGIRLALTSGFLGCIVTENVHPRDAFDIVVNGRRWVHIDCPPFPAELTDVYLGFGISKEQPGQEAGDPVLVALLLRYGGDEIRMAFSEMILDEEMPSHFDYDYRPSGHQFLVPPMSALANSWERRRLERNREIWENRPRAD